MVGATEIAADVGGCYVCAAAADVVVPLGVRLCPGCLQSVRQQVDRLRLLRRAQLAAAATEARRLAAVTPEYPYGMDISGFTPAQAAEVERGVCPECGRVIRGYTRAAGPGAKKVADLLRANGVDPGTGHRMGCGFSRLVIRVERAKLLPKHGALC